eukprot:5317291-Amphidinium_carterae.1
MEQSGKLQALGLSPFSFDPTVGSQVLAQHHFIQWETHPDAQTSVSSSDKELVLGDLASWLDARPISHPCCIWHPLWAVPEIHGAAIVRQAEPPAALGEDLPYIPSARHYHHCGTSASLLSRSSHLPASNLPRVEEHIHPAAPLLALLR